MSATLRFLHGLIFAHSQQTMWPICSHAYAAGCLVVRRRILLIDDDQVTHTVVAGALDFGLELISCYSLQEGLQWLEAGQDAALVIVDRGLPDGDGLTICSKMRADPKWRDTPVIFLSGMVSETDKVGGLFAGADDYIGKPVSPLELKARIQARLRSHSNKISIGNLSIDLGSHRAFVMVNSQMKEIELTRIEFKLLLTLVQSPDQVFSREQIIAKVWGSASNLSDRVVDTHLSHLRKKIDGTALSIQSLRGEGYRLTLDAAPKSQAS